ncbi:MAG: phytochelatin synthase family protein [Myxococcales bacterium]|nr:phytochelatin synthase family protein [Myxococcales bacterium]MDP3502570.1 phytochelatin synthase family protein [Myxococcales bacterium]
MRRALGSAAVVVAGAAFAFFLSQREVPSTVTSIERSPTWQSPALLEKAWALPVAAMYRAGYDVQRNASFCGPASVVNVQRSLGAPSDQSTVLEGTGVSTLLGFVPGLTLDELASVTRHRTGRSVTILRELELPTLRAQLAMANDPAVRFIANFHRGPLFGRGGGHHSPIAGYLPEEDLVFVLDVNASYRPWLVSPERLLDAMDTIDSATGLPRGLLRVEPVAP